MARPEITIYGSGCPACMHAAGILDRHRLRYREEPIERLPKRFGIPRTQPRIVIDDELIGGVDDLIGIAQSGALKRLAEGDDEPWVEVRRRRLASGYVVITRDRLGRERAREQAATAAAAEALAETARAGR
jgi:glutaredoxin